MTQTNHNPVFRFRDWDVTVVLSRYADDIMHPAIQLRAADTEHNEKQDLIPGEPIAVATVNLPEWELEPREVFIKSWAENEGMFDWLYENGLIEPTGKFRICGWVTADVGLLTKKFYSVAGRL